MKSSQKESEKKPDVAELDVDYEYGAEDDYNEEFDYADQQDGDADITEYNEEEGYDENYTAEENAEAAQDQQQEEYS